MERASDSWPCVTYPNPNSLTLCSSVPKHQCGRCPQCPETGAGLASGWVPKEEGTGQAAEGEGQTSQAGAQGKGKEKDTKRGAKAITLINSSLCPRELTIGGRTGGARGYFKRNERTLRSGFPFCLRG